MVLQRFRNEHGEISTYIAFAICLPILLMVFLAAVELPKLVETMREIAEVRNEAMLQVEIAGGLTPQIESGIVTACQAYGLDASKVQVAGSPPPVTWGGQVYLEVTYAYGFKTDFMQTLSGLVGEFRIGGRTYGTSNYVPPS